MACRAERGRPEGEPSVFSHRSERGGLDNTARGRQCAVRSPAFRRSCRGFPAKAGTTNLGHFVPRAISLLLGSRGEAAARVTFFRRLPECSRHTPCAVRPAASCNNPGSGVGGRGRESPGKKDFLPAIAPKKRRHAGNRSQKKTLRQESLRKNDVGADSVGRTIPGPVVGAAFVPPMTTLVKPRCRPEGLAVKNLRRGPGAARILGGAPSAGAAGEKRKFVSQKFTADCRNGRARACKTISWAILLNPRKRSALGFN